MTIYLLLIGKNRFLIMVYIKSIDKDIFPKYVLPFDDEIFTSWLCRISENHGLKAKSFITSYIEKKYPLWNRDIDVMAPEELISFFSCHMPNSELSINDLFLKSFDGSAFHKIQPKGLTLNILPVGVKAKQRSRFGQQCCCSCLSKNQYYKKIWRLSTSIICTECNEYLIDRCPKCISPISYFRINFGGNSSKPKTKFLPLSYCYNCNYDLSKFTQKEKPNCLEKNYQLFINKTINNGYNQKAKYSFTYIRILFALSLRLRSNTQKNRFKTSIEELTSDSYLYFNKQISHWSVEERRQTFPIITEILNERYSDLEHSFQKNKVLRSTIFKDTHEVPYWFEKIFNY